MLEIGIQSRGIIRENVMEEGYKRIRNSGMTCVDYNIVSPKNKEQIDVSYYKKHKECADKYKLKFSQVHAPIIKYEIEQPEKMSYILEETRKSIAICNLLGSPYLVIHPFELAFQVGRKEEKRINLEFFTALIETALQYKVIVCIENMPYRDNERFWEGSCSRAEDVVGYINILNGIAGRECFGACFDVGHANVLGKNLREEIETLNRYLKVLHIHDNDGQMDSHQLPYSFLGSKSSCCTTDWNGFLLGLRKISYQGVLSFETFRSFTNVPGVLQGAMLSFLYEIGCNFSKVICFDELLEQMGTRKKIVFGAGKMLNVYMKEYGEKYPPELIVDNNASLWGTQKYGITIGKPQDIGKVPREDRKIIICNAYYEEIIEQLANMNIFEYELTEEILRMNGKPL